MKKTYIVLLLLLPILWIVSGCMTYERQVPSFRMPETFSNMQVAAGARVAARAYVDPKEEKKAFGFDIRKAGLLPIQVVFDNIGDNKIEINPSQTFLIDQEGNVWPVLTNEDAYERLSITTEFGNIGKSAIRRGALGAAAGAIIGAAVGVVSGENVLESAGKGAAVGAAAGATIGGTEELVGGETERKISQDLKNRSLKNRVIGPHEIAYGFIFFPAEALNGRELQLQLKEAGTENKHNLRFVLQ
ncbi:MAG: hypothetical protein V3R93_03025 [Candidatus Hydrothermarchaeaceae archaeon]